MRPTASAPAPCAPLGRWPDLSGLGRSSSNVGASLLAMLVVKVRATVLRGLAETSDPVHSGRALLPLRSAGNRAPRGPAHTRAQGREVLIRPHARAISFGDRQPRPASAAQPRCTPARVQPSAAGADPRRRRLRRARPPSKSPAIGVRSSAPPTPPPISNDCAASGPHTASTTANRNSSRRCPLQRHQENRLSFRGVCHLLEDKLFRPPV